MDWTIIVALISAAVAVASWATSARKSRVDNLVRIIDAQSDRIKVLEEEITVAKARITELEFENRIYRRALKDNCIEVDLELGL